MGNQTSRVERLKDGKRFLSKKKRRPSAASTNTNSQQSQPSETDLSSSDDKQAGYGAGAIQDSADASSSGRRKSITNIFTRRKSTASQSITLTETREHDRYQKLHYILKMVREGNIKARLDSPALIVDIGTGNGIWAIEVANEYPNAQVLAVDRRCPRHDRPPANLKFSEFDIQRDTWPIEDKADYIFQRNMNSSIEKGQWPHILSEMYRILKPGGCIELVEIDVKFHNAGPVCLLYHNFLGRDDNINYDMHFEDTMESYLKEAGFSAIEPHVEDIPIGEWDEDKARKNIGYMNKETHRAFMNNNRSYFLQRSTVTNEEYDGYVKKAMTEFDEYKTKSRIFCWIAHKSFTSEGEVVSDAT